MKQTEVLDTLEKAFNGIATVEYDIYNSSLDDDSKQELLEKLKVVKILVNKKTNLIRLTDIVGAIR